MTSAPSLFEQMAAGFVKAMVLTAHGLQQMIDATDQVEAQLEAARQNPATKPAQRQEVAKLLAIFHAAREFIAAVKAFSQPPEGPRHGV